VRRLAPRPLQGALDRVTREAAPAGVLAEAQARWADVAGPVVASEAEPISEREGVVTVACRSAVWAQELELLAGDLRERLNVAMGPSRGPAQVRKLRFVVRLPGQSGERP
jgi:predicted nucleic acid-binding Zn ribbon protein